MMYKIEKKRIPIPGKVPFGKRRKYPFREMKIGESFFVRNGKQIKISSSVHENSIRLQRKFTMRTMDGGVRVWRIK